MPLTNRDLVELTAWRRHLHRYPEISGEEAGTAAAVAAFLVETAPDALLGGLGGHGVAVVYASEEPGPTLLFRAELDALPIEEIADVPHRSSVPGLSHMCGHDGHMTILAGLGRLLGRQRPARGRAVLLFQPAEETGMGAQAVVADPRFASIAPDFAFALHNLPGVPLGEVLLKPGVVNCASRGMRIVFEGRTAHASMPETGVTPLVALSRLLPELGRLGQGAFTDDDFAMVTVTHASMGQPAFGIAPGRAEIWATLRTRADDSMAALCALAERLAVDVASAERLACSFDYHEVFAASINAHDALEELRRALDAEDVRHAEAGLPMRASEDFGVFGGTARSAMFFLGAGATHPALHNPDYDFPDDLIPIGTRVFLRVVRNLLG